MKYTATLILSLLLVNSLLANDKLERINYNWEENPTLADISVEDTNVAVYVLKNFLSKELMEVDGELYEYNTIHKKVKLLTDRGIESYNRVYLPVPDKDQLFIEKARVITSSGEVINLKEEDIKEGIDEETEQRYRYFAFDGVDLNAEIEYIFMYRRNPSLSGNLINVQQKVPQLNYSFELIAPHGLVFAFKSYNNLPEMKTDTNLVSEKEKLRWFLDMDSVVRLPQQRSSAYEAELMYFGYKLSKNLYRRLNDLFSYGELSKRVHNVIFEPMEKNDQKFLNKIYKKIEFNEEDEVAKIRAIENYVKGHLTIYDMNIPNTVPLEDLWEAKVANDRWVMKIMTQLFLKADIDVQVVMTCDRFDYKFDKDFELWSYPNDYLFYFPAIDSYTSPGDFERLNQIDYSYLSNYGLFVKSVEVAGENFGVGTIERIPINDYKLSGDTLRVHVDIATQGFDELSVSVYHSLNGYKADYFQPYYEVINEKEDQEEFAHSLINFIDNNGEVENYELLNAEADLYGLKPLIASGDLKTSMLFDRAKENQLFKVGELIGPQMEMYDTEDRELPVEDAYARHYHRVISFTIPDDYEIQNLEDLVFDETYEDQNGDKTMVFSSNYQVNGNKVTVTIDEYYKQFYFPLSLFEDYTRVINAAADFNKVVLVFIKK